VVAVAEQIIRRRHATDIVLQRLDWHASCDLAKDGDAAAIAPAVANDARTE
jgi:hypothetical protein